MGKVNSLVDSMRRGGASFSVCREPQEGCDFDAWWHWAWCSVLFLLRAAESPSGGT
jgi:hypothetical protein